MEIMKLSYERSMDKSGKNSCSRRKKCLKIIRTLTINRTAVKTVEDLMAAEAAVRIEVPECRVEEELFIKRKSVNSVKTVMK